MGICHPRPKKCLCPGGQPGWGGGEGLGGWMQLELTDAHIALVNSAVRCNIFVFKLQNKKKNETRMRKHEFFIWR